jgi:hypothetical protein
MFFTKNQDTQFSIHLGVFVTLINFSKNFTEIQEKKFALEVGVNFNIYFSNFFLNLEKSYKIWREREEGGFEYLKFYFLF